MRPSPRKKVRPLSLEALENRHLLASSTIQVRAAGETGTEQFDLRIDGALVRSWTDVGGDIDTGEYRQFNYTHPTEVRPGSVQVVFTNDGTINGVDRNLAVDGITIDGFVYETEWDNVYSSRAVWAAGRCASGYFKSELLACGGGVSFGGMRIEVQAAGATGHETMALEIDGEIVETWTNVGGDFDTGQFESFVHDSEAHVAVDDVRVWFTNDGQTLAGEDLNLRVDNLRIGDLVYETEAPTTFSTGTYSTGTGCGPGSKSSEYLQCSGYFQYAGTRVEIRAAGATGEEAMALQIDGQTVATFEDLDGDYARRGFVTYAFDSPSDVEIDQIRILFTNDGTTAQGADKNIRVDSVSLNGVTYEAESTNVLSTGTWLSDGGCRPGNKASEFLHCGGYLQFGVAPNPGTLSLGTSLISVNEQASSVSIPFIRSGGSDGIVSLDFTTVNGSAVAGQDYTRTSGTVTFAPGEMNKTVTVPITNDTDREANETFVVSADRVGGGAALGQPRTATITIVDDDQGPTPGTGNGLLGVYFDDVGLTDPAFERTDPSVDFNWGVGSPDATIAPDTFSVRWVGQIEPLYSEEYTFYTTSDDGIRLWIDGQQIIDHWNDHVSTVRSGRVTLQAGQRYDVRMEYYERTGFAVAKLEWSSPSQSREVVPQLQLYSESPSNIVGTFAGETVITGLTKPTSMEFAAGGRMFIAQQNGIVRLAVNGQLRGQPFIDISEQVNGVRDRGLLGMAVDPQFPTRPYVYLLFTYDPPESQAFGGSSLARPDGAGNRVARLIRVTADPTTNYMTALPNSELVLVGKNSTWDNISNPDKDGTVDITLPPSCGGVSDCLPTDSQSHTVGAVVFGSDGSLFVTVGDGTSYGRVDPRTVRTQDLDSLSGKILRIHPATGSGYTDNPFYNGNVNSNRSKVYSYGVRNSFRAAVHPESGELYSGDVGWAGWEEINVGAGKNFGWPYYEGGDGQNRQTGGYRGLPEAQAFYASGGVAEPPLWSRTHADGARAIVVGDFYQGARYPSLVENALFFSDYGEPTIRALLLQDNGEVDRVLQISGRVGVVVEMENGADGYMYYVDIVAGEIGRLTYTEDAARAAVQQANLPENGGASSGIVTISGSDSVAIYAKDNDNVMRFDARSPGIITIDGVDHELPTGVKTIRVHGQGGNDQVEIIDTDESDDVYLRADSATFKNSSVTVDFFSVEQTRAVAGSGSNDRVFMYDSVGDDVLESRPDRATLVGEDFAQEAIGFRRYYVYSRLGGDDSATLYGTEANDLFRGSLTYGRLIAPDHYVNVAGFSATEAFAGGGRKNRAAFYDSENDETFISHPTWSSVDGGNYYHKANGFQYVSAYGGQGNDVADLYDSERNDRFYGYATSATLKGVGFSNMAKGFDVVTGHASTGADRAYLIDSALADHVYARESYVRIQSQDRLQTATGFDIAIVKGTNGGENTWDAALTDFRLIKRGRWTLRP